MANHDFPSHISYAEARAIIARIAEQRRMPNERVAIARAHGRVLAGDVVASMAMPAFDNSAMDGFALRHADLAADGETILTLRGEQFAGPATVVEVGPGECARITTGAPLPPGADTVVMKERAVVEGDCVRILGPVAAGRNVRRRGEDVVAGDLLALAGEVLGPARVALLAAQGIDSLEVARRPTVAVFSTGDELVEPGMPLAHGQVYNSNRELLMGLLRAEGLEPVAWPTLPDDGAAIESALRHAGEAFDVVLTCGGVSAGEKDLLPALLQRRGSVHFWKLRMRPGMPALFADGGTLGPALFLCLPGNPVSVLATCLALARPLLDGLQGRAPRKSWRARLSSPWCKRHERREFLRGRLLSGEDGVLLIEPDPADGSHRMRAAADADALMVLEEGEREYAAGSVVEVLLY
ncbi:molybdopterin molybdotransferase MoeA [Luteimonas sp. A482]